MKHIVSFSGGRTSAYLVHLMEQKRINNNWDVSYVFMDTGAEHPKTYEFIRKCVDYFNIELTCIKPVTNPQKGIGMNYKVIQLKDIGWNLSAWNNMTNKYGNPYGPQGGFCTSKLKTDIHTKYIKQFPLCTTWIGIRLDETRRLKRKANIRYLAELSPFDKVDVMGWWKAMSFDLDLYEHLGNCVFCIKKGVNKVALAIKDEPELAEQWEAMLTSSKRREADIGEIDAIYRGRLNINGITELYKDYDRDELHMSLKHAKRFESGSCSESCEVFGCQQDMFDEL